MDKKITNPFSESKTGVEVHPEDEAIQLENHILAESFKRNNLDYDKIQRQSNELKM